MYPHCYTQALQLSLLAYSLAFFINIYEKKNIIVVDVYYKKEQMSKQQTELK